MSIDNYLEKMKKVQNDLQIFVENNDNLEENYQSLTTLIDEQKIANNKHELKSVLYLINQISNNHFRTPNFISKIEQILQYLKDQIKQNLSNSEIFQIFKRNKRVLLFLIKNEILIIDENIYLQMKNDEKCKDYLAYFYPEVKSFLTKELNDEISPKIVDNFEEKRLKGENDSYICELVRKDLVKEFVAYVSKTNLSISEPISSSIFETNPLLMQNEETTLIEYAAFFGSIQILQYLRLNKIQMDPNLWIYVIHGRNAELIHLLESDKVEAPNNDFKRCLRESIRCYHDEIRTYIQNTFIHGEEKPNEIYANAFDFYDFASIKSDFVKDSFFLLCKKDYYVLVDSLLNSGEISVNALYNQIIHREISIFSLFMIFQIIFFLMTFLFLFLNNVLIWFYRVQNQINL